MVDISVVIPLYNKRDYIIRAVQSVLEQTYQALEIIVVDDGSNDGSAELVRKLAHSKIRIIRQSNQGVSSARNTGWKASMGAHIAFLDADDYWQSSFLEQIGLLIESYPDAGAYCSAYSFLIDGVRKPAKLSEVPHRSGLLDNYYASASKGHLPVTASSVVIKKSKLQQFNGFPVGWPMGEDQFMWMSLASHSKIAFVNIDLVTYVHQVDGSACSVNKVLEPLPHVKLLNCWLQEGVIAREHTQAVKVLLNRSGIYMVLNNISSGRTVEARAYLKSLPYISWNVLSIASFVLSYLPNKWSSFVIQKVLKK
ncbi:hypothetical protein GCM10009092_17350 [Bowmanella denitrificans]|uniref:Glycosyltransferase 2-like domain-containing protein n=1 Tax=Bowmanella denitrificans TaxID=366582 RepID=A0ABN0X3J8_9ALTE